MAPHGTGGALALAKQVIRRAAARIEIPFVLSLAFGKVMCPLVAMGGAGGAAVFEWVGAVAVILWAVSIDALHWGRVIAWMRKATGGALTRTATIVVRVATVGIAVRRRGMTRAGRRNVRIVAQPSAMPAFSQSARAKWAE
jgi:hypothetical protein